MRSIRSTMLVLLVLPLSGAWAANPGLTAQVQGIRDPSKESADLRLASLEIDIDVAGALADATMTARFANSADQVLEGQFSFALPESAVVTGYALDVQGRMLDGVLVDPLKAQRTYEEKVRQGIDPGVAKISRDNRFTTSIYPIPPRGTRTIRLKFSAPVHRLRGLAFPLVTMSTVEEVRIAVRTAALRQPPALTLPNGSKADWQASGEGHVASVRFGLTPLTGELRIGPVQARQPALESRHENGERRVHILDAASGSESQAVTGRKLRVYWDRSLSRRDQSLAAERQLLGKYLAQSRPSAIDLVVFNSSGARVQRVTAADIDTALREVLYRGATSFAVLEGIAAPDADLCLMFTDGVATIDARRVPEGCEMFVITSAKDADRGFLQRLAGGVPGAVLQLGTQSEAEILGRLQGAGPRVVQARTQDGRALKFSSLDGGADGWSVIAEAPASGDIVLRIAGPGGVTERRYPSVPVHGGRFDAAGALWAADYAARLAADDGEHAAFVDLSRKFSIASPGLSFLVLETPRDYVDAGIEPPANYPDEWRQAYRELAAEHEKDRRRTEAERLADVQELWGEVKSWWRTRFDPNARKKNAPKPLESRGVRGLVQGVTSAPAAAPAVTPPPTSAGAMADAVTAEDIGRMPARRVAESSQRTESLEEVSVTGMRRWLGNFLGRNREVPERPIEVNLADWSVKRPYIQALNDAAPGDVDAVIAAEEARHGALPAFYFDVAEWLHRKQRVNDALEMLLSALELPKANEETLSMVADRLLRYGSAYRAIWLLQRAAERTDYLPQPRRSLALALAKRAESGGKDAAADLQRAVRLLDEVIMTPWQGEYDGIEIVSLMDANALLPRLEALGIHEVPLHESLRELLDVDLRVVIEWNTGATDMDLWVDEPNGERAIYDNPRTNIGGRLSNDMTSGYGPEEYLLRRAATGEYQVSVNVYASDAINPNGTTVVTAKLYRNFGRATQSERTLEIELLPSESGAKLIGKFTVQ